MSSKRRRQALLYLLPADRWTPHLVRGNLFMAMGLYEKMPESVQTIIRREYEKRLKFAEKMKHPNMR